MKKKETKKGGVIQIARPGEATQEVKIKKGTTVEELLEQQEISLSSGEELYVEGMKAEMEDELEAGDLLQIVGKKEGGNDDEEEEA